MSDWETDAGILSLLDEGTRRHYDGDLEGAASHYERVLAIRPDNTDALNLLGIVALQCGAADRAAELLHRAVDIDPHHPGYLNNLGQALDAQGEVAAALRCYLAAEALAPGDARILNNIGLARCQMGDLEGALEAAVAALQADPANAEFQHNHGAILMDMDRLDEAEDAFRRALALNQHQAGTHANLARVFAEKGRREEAVKSCLRATEIDPLYVEGHEACRKLLWDAGDADNMNMSYFRACEQHPNSAQAFLNLGGALLESGKPDQAVAALTTALSLDPHNAATLSKTGAALTALGRHDEAIVAHKEAIAIDNSVAAHFEALGDCYADRRQFNRAASAFLSAYERNPRRSSILGSLTIALNEIRDPLVHKFVDYDRFVTTRAIEPPPAFDSVTSFNNALHDELAALHEPRPDPIGQTMHGGTQNRGHLFRGSGGLIAEIRDRLAAALRQYIESLYPVEDDPFLRFANPDFRFTGAWSTILPENAYDESHIHNDGWISGVYYVKTPEIGASLSNESDGCIQFGRPPRHFESERNTVCKRIRPRPGVAVFFPSYYWHGVEPFRHKGIRHSIAFDAI